MWVEANILILGENDWLCLSIWLKSNKQPRALHWFQAYRCIFQVLPNFKMTVSISGSLKSIKHYFINESKHWRTKLKPLGSLENKFYFIFKPCWYTQNTFAKTASYSIMWKPEIMAWAESRALSLNKVFWITEELRLKTMSMLYFLSVFLSSISELVALKWEMFLWEIQSYIAWWWEYAFE